MAGGKSDSKGKDEKSKGKEERRKAKDGAKSKEKEVDPERAARREERARRREEKERALRDRNAGTEPTRPVEDSAQRSEAADVRPPSAYLGGGYGGRYGGWQPSEIDERAFSQQLAALHGALNGQVALKKRELVGTAQRIEANIERVQSARSTIERETRADFDGILERLRVHERSKVAVLQSELARLLATISEIDDFTADVLNVGMAATAEQRRAAAPRLPALADRSARLAAIHVDQPPHVRHDDFPREVEARRGVIARHDALEGVLRIKDAVCWALLSERQAAGANGPLVMPDGSALDLSTDGAGVSMLAAMGGGQSMESEAAAAAAAEAAEERLRAVAEEYEAEMREWSALAEGQSAQLQASADELARLRSANEELRARLAAMEGSAAVRAALELSDVGPPQADAPQPFASQPLARDEHACVAPVDAPSSAQLSASPVSSAWTQQIASALPTLRSHDVQHEPAYHAAELPLDSEPLSPFS